NNDGYNDIVSANFLSDDISILLWNPISGSWKTKITKPTGDGCCCVFIEDANNDGYNEIITSNAWSNDISILIMEPYPIADFITDYTIIYEGDSIIFTFTGFEGNAPAKYFWDFGDGTISREKNPVHKYSIIGIYTIKLLVNDMDGDSDVEIKRNYIDVREDLQPIADFVADKTSVGEGEDIMFTFTGSEGNSPATYSWDFGDETTSTEQNPTHHYISSGFYTVSLSVIDINGDIDIEIKANFIYVVNTPVGNDVEVTDEVTGINLIFEEVISSGTTTIEISEEEPDPPNGFEVAGEYYDIHTDASYSGVISIAIPYNEADVKANEDNLKIMHWEPLTGWTDVTMGVDTINKIIYGEFTTLSTFVLLEKVEHEYIMWEIDQLIEKLNDCPDTCWRNSSYKIPMINKLIELKELVSSNELAEAYDKLLHDIKPKLTGLKTDENEDTWGNGVFKDPWVTCIACQEEFCLDCNRILNHLSVLHSSLEVGSSILNKSNQIIYFSSFLLGLLGIAFIRSKEKLIPSRTKS
ncbi:MAG: PKD domain-containing protein, partial [Candidatus Hermodarchaeota archaeon]